MIISKERYEKVEDKFEAVTVEATEKVREADQDDRLKLEMGGMKVMDVKVYESPEDIPVFKEEKEEDQFQDVEFTPSDENPIKCKHCGQNFAEHFKRVVKCHDTTKKLMMKRKYKRLEEAKYDKPCRDAKQVIKEASSDSLLKLKIKLDNGLQVLEADEVEDREDLIEAFKK